LNIFDLDRNSFLCKYNLREQNLERCGTSWGQLVDIANSHVARTKDLDVTAQTVIERLRGLPAVHSLKSRIKDPEHLIAKIVRKSVEGGKSDISPSNYEDLITDLIGVRALHLFKDQWKPIHDYVTKTWDLGEKPKAYVRRGDHEALLNGFIEAGCDVQEHPFGYRSIHYLLKSTPTKESHVTELQVRTLFEEAWTEIDHTVRYPNHSNDPVLAQCLVLFNRFAGSADEMGSFIKLLVHVAKERGSELEEKEKQLAQHRHDLEDAIAKLQISQDKKSELELKLKNIEQSSREKDDVIIRRYSPIYEKLFAAWPPSDVARDITAAADYMQYFPDLPPELKCANCEALFPKIDASVKNGQLVCRRCQSP
jgi:ppGpp synthetase/RelA/SpoT-type nucleotidyltranferase